MPILGPKDFEALAEIDPFRKLQNTFSSPIEEPESTEEGTERDFFSKPISPKQHRALAGAKTEARNAESMLRGSLGGKRFEEETKEGADSVFGTTLGRIGHALSTATEPLFDLLQIGQFTGAGLALELHRSGLGYEAFRRASSEFINAFPTHTEEEAFEITGVKPTRPSYAEVVDKVFDFKPFENERHNVYAQTAAGFVLDVVLDPLTYVGGRLISTAGKGLKTGGKAIGLTADTPGIAQVREAVGKKFVPFFDLKEIARKDPRFAEVAEKAISGRRTMEGEIQAGLVNMKDLTLQLSAGLSPVERRLMLLYLDEPDMFVSVAKSIAPEGSKKYKDVVEKYRAFQNEFMTLAKEESKPGLFSPMVIRANYAPGRYPTTGTSDTAFKDLMDRLGIPEARQNLERTKVFQDLVGQGRATFEKQKKYDHLSHRVLAATPTELDIGHVFHARGIEHVRAVASKRFASSVLSDPNAAIKITDPKLIATVKRGGGAMTLNDVIEDYGLEASSIFRDSEAMRKYIAKEGLGVYNPLRSSLSDDLLSVGGLRVKQRFAIPVGLKRFSGDLSPEDEIFEVLGKPKKGKFKGQVKARSLNTGEVKGFDRATDVMQSRGDPLYLMPKGLIKALEVSDNIFSSKHEGVKFFGSLLRMQNLWKGYAVLSPGFHLRNMYSNWFNNWLGGVKSPLSYTSAWRVQAPELFAEKFGIADNFTLKLKDGRVLVGSKEILDEARRQNVYKRGLFSVDLPDASYRKLHKEMYKFQGDSKKMAKAIRESNEELWEESLEISALQSSKRSPATKGPTVNRPLLLEAETPSPRLQQMKLPWITRRELAAAVVETTPTKAQKATLKEVFGQENPVLRLNRWAGEQVENNARLAHWIDKVQKGFSPEEAATSTRKYLFDYNELSDFERDIMKSVIPFYTWMRKNIPLQIQAILENPGQYSRMTAKPVQAIENLSREWEEVETPDYFAEIHAIRLPKEAASYLETLNTKVDDLVGGEEGQQRTGYQPTFLNPNFPWQDLNRLNSQDFISGLSPYLKIPIEMIGGGGKGYSIFLDRPIERFEGEPSKVSILPGVDLKARQKVESLLESALPPYGKMQRMRKKIEAGEGATQILTEGVGLKLMQVDVEQAKRTAAFGRRRKLRQMVQKYKALGELIEPGDSGRRPQNIFDIKGPSSIRGLSGIKGPGG